MSKTPLHLADIAKYIDMPDMSHTCYHMRQAIRVGVVKTIVWYGGWVATKSKKCKKS